ncbi:MAG: hypothetical protein WC601_09880, partial [Desulfotomaculaceae bacterium]
FKIAFPLMLMSIVISTGYLLFWYVFHTQTAMLVTLGTGIMLALLLKPVTGMLLKNAKRKTEG